MADNLRGMELVRYPGPDLEPFGFTVLIASLGAVAVRRVITDSQRLVVMDRELAIARQIQSSILPQSMPRVPGLAVAARYRPMTQVAGDFYDFLEIEGIGLGVLVADVAGHGVPAALIASMVKVALGAQRERATSPAGVLAGMSDALRGRLGGRHVTAAYLFLDLRCGVARYAAAGHPPMLRSDRNAGTVEEVTKNGLFFGFSRPTGYQELELQLREHDRFLLYTDGLVEAIDGAEEQYGIERLTAAFASMSPRTPDEASDGLVTAVDAWASGVANDDLTLVTIDVAPPLRGQQEAKSES
jgi:sigma-B regulation protein RsbU (phosphoserine phosphatase)